VVTEALVRREGDYYRLVITFNQAMVALGPTQPQVVFKVHPTFSAQALWTKTDELTLAFEKPLPLAHIFKLEIAAGLKALNGATLTSPYRFRFETSRPQITSVALKCPPDVSCDRLGPQGRLLLLTNTAVSAPELAKYIALKRGTETLTFDIAEVPDTFETYDNAGQHQRFWLTPRPFAASEDTSVELVVRAGWHAHAGPLQAQRTFREKWAIYQPLKVRFLCDEKDTPLTDGQSCYPMNNGYFSGLRMRFTEPVRRKTLESHFVLSPSQVKLQPTDGLSCGDEDCGREWSLRGDLQPKTTYTVRLKGGVTDVYQRALPEPLERHFETRSFPPGLFLPAQAGHVLPLERGLAYRYVGLEALSVQRQEVSVPEAIHIAECQLQHSAREEYNEEQDTKESDLSPCLNKLTSVSSTKTNLSIKPNTPDVHNGVLELKPGFARLTWSSPQIVDSEQHIKSFERVVWATDLGLHARFTPWGLYVWVTSLQTAKARPGVSIEVRNSSAKTIWQGKTGADGSLTLEDKTLIKTEREAPRWYVVARFDQDISMLAVGQPFSDRNTCNPHDAFGHAMDPPDDPDKAFDASEDNTTQVDDGNEWETSGEIYTPTTAAYVSTERGIYRPGQPVYAHGAVRAFERGRATPLANAALRVQLSTQDRIILAEHAVSTDAWGLFRTKFALPQTAQLGDYTVKVFKQQREITSYSFDVKHYREPRFKLETTLHDDIIDSVSNARIDIQATRFSGGALDEAPYTVTLEETPVLQHWLPPHYVLQTLHETLMDSKTTTRKGRLNRQGHARVELPPTGISYAGVIVGRISITTVDLDGRRIVKSLTYTRFPAELMPLWIDHRLHLINTEGKKARGRVTVSVFENPGQQNASWRQQFNISESGKKINLPLARWAGKTVSVFLEVTDSAGRIGRSSYDLAVAPNKETVDRMPAPLPDNEEPLIVQTEQELYTVGDTATITVVGGHAFERGRLFIEQDEIFHVASFTMQPHGKVGIAKVRVPVEERYGEFVTLRAVLYGHLKAVSERENVLHSASTTLQVNDHHHSLDVALKPARSAYKPREKVEIDVQVNDNAGRGRHAALVIMAVDESVLRLTNFSLPDPLSSFTLRRDYLTWADDSRRYLLPAHIRVDHVPHDSLFSHGFGGCMGYGSAAGLGAGGGGSGDMKGPAAATRRLFDVAAWHTQVETDVQGHVKTSFTLPDSLTTFRIMAFAVDKTRSAGVGDALIQVSLPIVTLTALPAMLRKGDHAKSGVMVQNTTTSSVAAVVRLHTLGTSIAVHGPLEHKVSLAPNHSQNVRFDLEALQAGTTRFRFDVDAASSHDSLEHALHVSNPIRPQTVATSGEFVGRERIPLGSLSDVHSNVGGLELSLASSPLVTLKREIEQLIEYPYGCVEQRGSKLLALAAIAALAKRFGWSFTRDPERLLKQGAEELRAFQNADGGFGYWPSGTPSQTWATAYALIVFKRLEPFGAGLTHQNLASALDYLDRSMARRDKHVVVDDTSEQVWAIFASSLFGRSRLDRIQRIAKQGAQTSPTTRALLLAALPHSPAAEATRKAWSQDLRQALVYRKQGAHRLARVAKIDKSDPFSTVERETAIALIAFIRAKAPRQEVEPLVRYLIDRSALNAHHTQQAAWQLMALQDFSARFEGAADVGPIDITLGRELKRISFGESQSAQSHLNWPMPKLTTSQGRPIEIVNRNKHNAYYISRLRYASRNGFERAAAHGIHIQKTIALMRSDGTLAKLSTSPQVGDVLVVTLNLTLPQPLPYVVIDDPLAAGLEAVDISLATESGRSPIRSDAADHHELRDDRVLFFINRARPGKHTYRYMARVTTPGSFAIPATHAEAMYQPEFHGRTAPSQIRVK